jgi:glycerophosphoryl diester phosphodiesterase
MRNKTLIRCGVVVLLGLSVFLFFSYGMYSPPQRGGEDSILDISPKTKEHLMVAHAMGSVPTTTMDGTGSNSREAFLSSYANGFRLFEADVSLASDNVVVLVHDGSESWVGLPEGALYNTTSSSVILNQKFRNAFTLLSWHDALELLQTHSDAYLILDIKDDFATMLEVMSQDQLFTDVDIRRRIIPQVYQESDMQVVSQYDFPDTLFTLYRTNMTDNEVIELIRKYPHITAVAMWWDKRYTDQFAKRLKKEGVGVYVHTLNESVGVKKFIKKEIGVYTDIPML